MCLFGLHCFILCIRDGLIAVCDRYYPILISCDIAHRIIEFHLICNSNVVY